MGKSIELTSKDGFTFSAYQADPQGTARGGLVVVQEIFGVNRHIRDVCDRFAKEGYVAIAPALFDRAQRGVDIGYSPEEITQGAAFKAKVRTEDALRDVAAARDAVASSGKVGITGYCWGGFITWMAAAKLDGFACAIPYYGGGILENMNEHPKCPLMAHFGSKDTHIPVEGVKKLQAAHPEIEVFIYDADHGFNCDQRGSHNAEAARLAWDRSLAFLRKHVG